MISLSEEMHDYGNIQKSALLLVTFADPDPCMPFRHGSQTLRGMNAWRLCQGEFSFQRLISSFIVNGSCSSDMFLENFPRTPCTRPIKHILFYMRVRLICAGVLCMLHRRRLSLLRTMTTWRMIWRTVAWDLFLKKTKVLARTRGQGIQGFGRSAHIQIKFIKYLCSSSVENQRALIPMSGGMVGRSSVRFTVVLGSKFDVGSLPQTRIHQRNG